MIGEAIRPHVTEIGRYLRPSGFTGMAVACELETLLGSEAVARACRAVASRFVGIDPVAQTCDLIEAVA